MNIVNISDIPVDHHRSPKGRFEAKRQHLSLAAGGSKDSGSETGGHPFDVELTRVPPGKSAWPLHSHSSQWEAFIIVSGTGRLLTNGEPKETEVRAGDFVLHPPSEAHQLINTGGDDLVYYIIATNPSADVVHHVESDKWFVKPVRKVFREVYKVGMEGYYDGEE
jgi:uncharacterized cupin superfamily protein